MKLAFLGDSVTEGCFELSSTPDGKGFYTVNDNFSVYHNQLRLLIDDEKGEGTVEILNAGISGDSAGGGASRVENDVIAAHPDLTVVSFGLNDVCSNDIDRYVAQLKKIFKALNGAEIPFIFMTQNMMNTYAHPHTLPCVADFAVQTAELQNCGRMDDFMDAAADTAIEFGGKVCDCYSEWRRMQHYGVDTTCLLANYINHPIRDMHRLFADHLYETLKNY